MVGYKNYNQDGMLNDKKTSYMTGRLSRLKSFYKQRDNIIVA
jgi:hypothetical protein